MEELATPSPKPHTGKTVQKITPLLTFLVSLILALACQAPPPLSSAFTPEAITPALTRVADWQLKNPSPHPPTYWSQAAYYTGMMALAEVAHCNQFPLANFIKHE